MIPSVTNTDGEYSEDELSDVEDSNDMDVMTGQFFFLSLSMCIIDKNTFLHISESETTIFFFFLHDFFALKGLTMS